MFSQPKLNDNAKKLINEFNNRIEAIKSSADSSKAAKVAAEKIQKIFSELSTSPTKIADILDVFNADAFESLVSDKHYRELFNLLINFMKANSPATLFDSMAVKLTFGAIEKKWNEAIANLFLIDEFCGFIAKSDEFSQKYNADEKARDSKEQSYIMHFENDKYKIVTHLLGQAQRLSKDKRNAETRLKMAGNDAAKSEPIKKEIVQLDIEILANFKKLKDGYNDWSVEFAKKDSSGVSDWDRLNQLPYYFVRGILPDSLTKDIEEKQWSGTRVLFFGCRERLMESFLQTELMIMEYEQKLHPNQPVSAYAFHSYMQSQLKLETKSLTALKENASKEIAALEKDITEYLKPAGVLEASKDKKKLEVFKCLSEELKLADGCISKRPNDVGGQIKYTFKAVLHAVLWHSKLLAEALKNNKKLSSGRAGTVLKKYYDIFFKMYFQLNEMNSGFYQTKFQDAKTIDAKTAVSLPVVAAQQLNAAVPLELQRFNESWKLLCQPKPQAKMAVGLGMKSKD